MKIAKETLRFFLRRKKRFICLLCFGLYIRGRPCMVVSRSQQYGWQTNLAHVISQLAGSLQVSYRHVQYCVMWSCSYFLFVEVARNCYALVVPLEGPQWMVSRMGSRWLERNSQMVLDGEASQGVSSGRLLMSRIQ